MFIVLTDKENNTFVINENQIHGFHVSETKQLVITYLNPDTGKFEDKTCITPAGNLFNQLDARNRLVNLVGTNPKLLRIKK